jgi:AraC-like DNA-binding protein
VADLFGRNTEAQVIIDLERLRALLGHEGVVLYISDGIRWAPCFRGLRKLGFSALVTAGVDDGKRPLQRALGTAATSVCLRSVGEQLESRLEPAAVEFFLRCLRTSCRVRTVCEMARAMGMSDRSLRRHSSEHTLPPPRELVRWGRLFNAFGYSALGVRSVGWLASQLNYSDASSLCRLFRSLLGCQASWALDGRGEALAVERLLDRWV